MTNSTKWLKNNPSVPFYTSPFTLQPVISAALMTTLLATSVFL